MRNPRSSLPSPLRTLFRVGPFLVLVALPARLGAQAQIRYSDVPAPERSQPLVFSISGGISLGAYQAGVNWGLLELYRTANAYDDFAAVHRLPKSHLGAITGASAGNINTLLWAIEACTRGERRPPESSLFWRIWTSVGLEQLLPEGVPDPALDNAIFDRAFFRDSLFPLLEERMDSPDLQRGCLVRLGVTLTRVVPDTLLLGTLPIQTQRFATLFSAGVDALNGGPMRFRRRRQDAAVYGDRSFGKLALAPRDERLQIPRDTIFDIVQASSAFPLAFQPLELALQRPGESEARSDLYLDGGLFDNNPVGLALGIYLDAFRGTLRNGRPDTVSVVYVNPGRLRGELAEDRATESGEVARGGLRSVLQTLGGAVGTARQYELQLLARDGRASLPDTVVAANGAAPARDAVVVHDTVMLRLTSRAHPLVGEHLHAFAAFLGRPFREYDFYVGVYDAFEFVAREYACRHEADAAAARGCIADAVAGLLASPRIDVGGDAPQLLAALYAREYREDRFAGQRRRVADAASAMKARGDADRTRLLLALFEAQETQYRHATTSCGNVPLPDLLLCVDRLGTLLRAFGAADSVIPILEGRRETCERANPERKGAGCREERNFLELVRDPEAYTARLIDLVLDRWLAAERRLRRSREREARAAGLDPAALPRLDGETPVEVLISLYRARPLRPRRGVEWSTTSAPDGAWLARYVFPDHVGAILGRHGIEAAYRPTWHWSTKLAAIAPLTYHRVTLPTPAPAPAGPAGEEHRAYLGGGAGIVLKGPFKPPAGLLVPALGLDVQRLGPTSNWWDEGVWMAEVYGDLSMIAGRMRFGFRVTEPDGPLFSGRRWGVFAGISDVGGLAYWLWAIAR